MGKKFKMGLLSFYIAISVSSILPSNAQKNTINSPNQNNTKPNSGIDDKGNVVVTDSPNNITAKPTTSGRLGEKKEYLEFFKKNGRPPNVPMMIYGANFTNSQWGFGEYRNWKKGGSYPRYHYGMDLGNGGVGGNRLILKMNADGRVTHAQNGTIIFERVGIPFKDRFAHHHAINSKNLKTGSILNQGQGYSTYSNISAGDHHDHVEYSVVKGDPINRTQFTKGVDFSTSPFRYKSLVNYGKTNFHKGYVTIDPIPYYPDIIRSVTGERWGSQVSSYLGTSNYTKFNALYGTQLPAIGKAPTKKIPNIPLNQVQINGGDISPDMLAVANMSAMESALLASDGGFDYANEIITQKVLASSFDDSDGESWSLVFGSSMPINVNEMTQIQLIKYMATRTYTNKEYTANLAKLSTKGLLMELLQQQAEVNYMLNFYKELKLQTLSAKALLARAGMQGADKALDGLADSIHVNYNPNFKDIELGSNGDEWLMGDGIAQPSQNSAVVINENLPSDMKALKRVLLENIAGHESNGSYNAYNKGTACKGGYLGKEPSSYAPIVNMTPAQILTRYYGQPYQTANGSPAVDCSKRLFAVGKYQFIPMTLSYLINLPQNKHLLHKPFNAENQEYIAQSFYTHKRKAMQDFVTGANNDINRVSLAIAQEWASIAVPKGLPLQNGAISRGCPSVSICDTYYNRQKGNRAFYESTQKVWATLQKMQEVKNSNKP